MAPGDLIPLASRPRGRTYRQRAGRVPDGGHRRRRVSGLARNQASDREFPERAFTLVPFPQPPHHLGGPVSNASRWRGHSFAPCRNRRPRRGGPVRFHGRASRWSSKGAEGRRAPAASAVPLRVPARCSSKPRLLSCPLAAADVLQRSIEVALAAVKRETARTGVDGHSERPEVNDDNA